MELKRRKHVTRCRTSKCKIELEPFSYRLLHCPLYDDAFQKALCNIKKISKRSVYQQSATSVNVCFKFTHSTKICTLSICTHVLVFTNQLNSYLKFHVYSQKSGKHLLRGMQQSGQTNEAYKIEKRKDLKLSLLDPIFKHPSLAYNVGLPVVHKILGNILIYF